MTTEERFDRMEHVIAGFAEERRKDREQDRQLWRDTQRQINELTLKVADIADEMRAADQRLGERIAQLAEESRAADQKLGERIENLVSAMGDFLRKRENGSSSESQ